MDAVPTATVGGGDLVPHVEARLIKGRQLPGDPVVFLKLGIRRAKLARSMGLGHLGAHQRFSCWGSNYLAFLTGMKRAGFLLFRHSHSPDAALSVG